MKLKTSTSYNITCDELKDDGSLAVALILSKLLYQQNIREGLEDGEPFISDLGVIVSPTVKPTDTLVVLAVNSKYPDSLTEFNLQDNIAEALQFILLYLGKKIGIRDVRASCKGYKKTETQKKYLNTMFTHLSEQDFELAKANTILLTEYGVPFYKKSIMVGKALQNLTKSNLSKLIRYRNLWGSKTLLHVSTYLTGDNPLPEYLLNELGEGHNSPTYKTNVLNFLISLSTKQEARFFSKRLLNL